MFIPIPTAATPSPLCLVFCCSTHFDVLQMCPVPEPIPAGYVLQMDQTWTCAPGYIGHAQTRCQTCAMGWMHPNFWRKTQVKPGWRVGGRLSLDLGLRWFNLDHWIKVLISDYKKIDGATPKSDFSISTQGNLSDPMFPGTCGLFVVPVVTPWFSTGVSWAMALVMPFRRGLVGRSGSPRVDFFFLLVHRCLSGAKWLRSIGALHSTSRGVAKTLGTYN